MCYPRLPKNIQLNNQKRKHRNSASINENQLKPSAITTKALRENPRQAPETTSEYLDKDAYEYDEEIDKEQAWNKLNLDLHIEYVDAKRNVTSRQIHLHRYAVNPSLTNAGLIAYCHLREANRHFYSKRIRRCIDLETGEVIQNIPAFLEEKYSYTTEGKISRAWQELENEIQVLIFIGKLDGRLLKIKKRAIAKYSIAQSNLRDITEEEFLESLKNTTSVSRHKFSVLIGRLSSKTTQEKQDLLRACRDILQAKKTNNPSEIEAIQYIARRWRIESENPKE